MRAAVLYELGRPLEILDGIELPKLEPGQVKVRVLYSGICQSQLMEARGHRGLDRWLPHLMGHEGVGQVVECGSEVKKVSPGDMVVLTWIKGHGADCRGASYQYNGTQINSGSVTTFNEFSIVSENRCVLAPKGVPLHLAWLFGCAILTGSGIVLNNLKAESHHSIAIYGLGGVGLSALMAANLSHCHKIIAIDIEETKLDLARSFGATHTINAKNDDPLSVIYDLTEGRGVDFAVEASGSPRVIEQAFRSVRNGGGRCVFASHPPHHERISLDPFDLICGKRIEGTWGGESKPDRDIEAFGRLYTEGRLPLEKLCPQEYSLNQINQALDDLENRRVTRAYINFSQVLGSTQISI